MSHERRAADVAFLQQHQRAMLSQPAQDAIARLEARVVELVIERDQARWWNRRWKRAAWCFRRRARHEGECFALAAAGRWTALQEIERLKAQVAELTARAERAERWAVRWKRAARQLRRRRQELLRLWSNARWQRRLVEKDRDQTRKEGRRQQRQTWKAERERDLWAAAWSGAITGDEFRAALGMDVVQWNDWRCAAAERGAALVQEGQHEKV